MKRVAFALLLAAATPALAQEFPYSTFGAELDSGALEGASELTPALNSWAADYVEP